MSKNEVICSEKLDFGTILEPETEYQIIKFPHAQYKLYGLRRKPAPHSDHTVIMTFSTESNAREYLRAFTHGLEIGYGIGLAKAMEDEGG